MNSHVLLVSVLTSCCPFKSAEFAYEACRWFPINNHPHHREHSLSTNPIAVPSLMGPTGLVRTSKGLNLVEHYKTKEAS